MVPKEKSRFETLYQNHLQALELQGKRPATIDAYSRAVRRVATFFDQCPDRLTQSELKTYLPIL